MLSSCYLNKAGEKKKDNPVYNNPYKADKTATS